MKSKVTAFQLSRARIIICLDLRAAGPGLKRRHGGTGNFFFFRFCLIFRFGSIVEAPLVEASRGPTCATALEFAKKTARKRSKPETATGEVRLCVHGSFRRKAFSGKTAPVFFLPSTPALVGLAYTIHRCQMGGTPMRESLRDASSRNLVNERSLRLRVGVPC